MYYVLHGEDDFLRAEVVAQLKSRMATEGMGDLNIVELDGRRCKLAELDDACRALPFFGERRMVLVRDFLGRYSARGKDDQDQVPREPFEPLDELLDRLQNNRSKIAANLSDPALLHRLREAYEASLATLLPIKQRLRDTDWLIDQIVYKLYGLTDEEIAIVEGRT